MSKTYYTEEHEWIVVEGDVATVGITNYAQEQLGDVVFIELPDVGDEVEKDGNSVVVESVKAASDVYAPIGGTITEINESLAGEPEIVNKSAESKGWLYKMTIANPAELEGLLDLEAYKALTG